MGKLIGHTFGMYEVVARDKLRTQHYMCKCSCGNVKSVRRDHIFDGMIVSCGCYKDRNAGIRFSTHGKSRHRLYGIHSHMMGRCYCETDKAYPSYGGRGIQVCDEWKSDFMSFYKWAVCAGYADGLSIDRIDNNGDYEPDNCRWTTARVQGNNKRNNRFLDHKGVRLTVSQWANRIGMDPKVLDNRLRRGWSIERALTQPLRGRSLGV